MNKRNIMLYTLGNINLRKNTKIVYFNETPDPNVQKRSQELYDALYDRFNIVAWACGRYGQREYSKEAGKEWSIKMEGFLQTLKNTVIDCSIQMCGHPTIIQPFPYFILSDFMPYVDISALDLCEFPTFAKDTEHEQDKMYQQASGVIAFSRLSQKMVIDYHGVQPTRTTVICSGVSENIHTLSQKKEKIILWAGSGFERKAGADVIDAFRLLRNKYDSQYELHMVGVEQQISEPGVITYPYFRGNDINKLSELYSRAKVFVMPSYRENLGLVYLEAMMHGTPIISTTRGGLAYATKRSKFGEVAIPGDIDGIYKNIIKIIGNNELYSKYVEQATIFAQNNARWDIVSSRINNAIDRWMTCKPVPSDYTQY